MSMEKKQHSIWERDITHEMIGVLAVFGLVVSSLVTGLGVATLGVQAQVAFAQRVGNANQTAAAIFAASLGENRPQQPVLPGSAAGSTTMRTASSTLTGAMRDIVSSSTALYCPKISKTIARGGKDATTTGDITELQRFIASHYNLEASSTISGYFGSTTEAYLKKFQQEQGIAPSPTVGPLTRAAILKLCAGAPPPMPMKGDTKPPMMGTSTVPTAPRGDIKPPQMGSTTPPMPPRGDMRPPQVPTSTRPVTMGEYEGSSNAAAVVSAIAEIGAGYNKLLDALLSLAGL